MNSAIPPSPADPCSFHSDSMLSVRSCSRPADGRHARVQQAHAPTLSTAPAHHGHHHLPQRSRKKKEITAATAPRKSVAPAAPAGCDGTQLEHRPTCARASPAHAARRRREAPPRPPPPREVRAAGRRHRLLRRRPGRWRPISTGSSASTAAPATTTPRRHLPLSLGSDRDLGVESKVGQGGRRASDSTSSSTHAARRRTEAPSSAAQGNGGRRQAI